MHSQMAAPAGSERYPLGLLTACLLGEDREHYHHRLIAESPRLFRDTQSEIEFFSYQDGDFGKIPWRAYYENPETTNETYAGSVDKDSQLGSRSGCVQSKDPSLIWDFGL